MPPYRPTQQKTPWISPAERRRTAALQDAIARTDASILTKLGKPRRGDIFVASAMEMNSSSVWWPCASAGICRPNGPGEWGGAGGSAPSLQNPSVIQPGIDGPSRRHFGFHPMATYPFSMRMSVRSHLWEVATEKQLQHRKNKP